jgi:uncharacterized protein DUF6582
VARLDATKRADLPDRAFAYIDSRGRRRLPINDEAHVRNALARFNQVKFEDELTRERARKRLLSAAKKYGIVPVGFITGQLQSERVRGEQRTHVKLPSGFVTMLMTDIEGSTVRSAATIQLESPTPALCGAGVGVLAGSSVRGR